MPKPKPVIWKRSISTRAQRERAFARRSLARERALAKMRGPSLLERLRRWLRR
ncbi:MAG: hypothetical protein ABSC51_10010 [Gaiellaceae bacterium]|jgi:hypothetical protein